MPYHPANISCLNFKDYETARKFHDSVKPIRGSNPPLRPVGSNRRYKHCAIEMEGEVILFKLYGNICMKYYKDGRVMLSSSGWPSYTTARFLDAILPVGTVYLSRRKLILATPTRTGRDMPQYVIPNTGWLECKADPDWGSITPINAEVTYNYVADRKALNAVRRAYKNFTEYLKVVGSMSEEYTSDEVIDYFPEVARAFVDRILTEREQGSGSWTWPSNTHWHMRGALSNVFSGAQLLTTSNEFWSSGDQEKASVFLNEMLELAQSDSGGDWRKLTLYLANTGNMYYTSNRHGQPVSYSTKHDLMATFVGKEYLRTPLVTVMSPVKNLLYIFDEILKVAYADICFTAVPNEPGVLPKERNSKYASTYNQIKDKLTRRQNVHI